MGHPAFFSDNALVSRLRPSHQSGVRDDSREERCAHALGKCHLTLQDWLWRYAVCAKFRHGDRRPNKACDLAVVVLK